MRHVIHLNIVISPQKRTIFLTKCINTDKWKIPHAQQSFSPGRSQYRANHPKTKKIPISSPPGYNGHHLIKKALYFHLASSRSTLCEPVNGCFFKASGADQRIIQQGHIPSNSQQSTLPQNKPTSPFYTR